LLERSGLAVFGGAAWRPDTRSSLPGPNDETTIGSVMRRTAALGAEPQAPILSRRSLQSNRRLSQNTTALVQAWVFLTTDRDFGGRSAREDASRSRSNGLQPMCFFTPSSRHLLEGCKESPPDRLYEVIQGTFLFSFRASENNLPPVRALAKSGSPDDSI